MAVGLLLLSLFRESFPALNSIQSVIIISLIFTLLVGSAHISGVRKAAKSAVNKSRNLDYRVRQTLEIQTHKTPRQVFDQICKSLKLPDREPETRDGNTVHMHFEAKGSFLSSGEEVEIRIRPLENGNTHIKAASQPLFRFSTVDFGKNLRNINLIERIVTGK